MRLLILAAMLCTCTHPCRILSWAKDEGAGSDTLQVLIRHGLRDKLWADGGKQDHVAMVVHMLAHAFPPAVVSQVRTTTSSCSLSINLHRTRLTMVSTSWQSWRSSSMHVA